MSATIGNLGDICKFLNADVYQRNFRPVELTEYVKCGDDIAKINWDSKEEQLLAFCRKATFHVSIVFFFVFVKDNLFLLPNSIPNL